MTRNVTIAHDVARCEGQFSGGRPLLPCADCLRRTSAFPPAPEPVYMVMPAVAADRHGRLSCVNRLVEAKA